MRLTEFWSLMERRFGAGYADSVARDRVVAGLAGRTVEEALLDGVDAKSVWRALLQDLGDEAPGRVSR